MPFRRRTLIKDFTPLTSVYSGFESASSIFSKPEEQQIELTNPGVDIPLKKFESSCILLIGRRGTGKSLTMSALALWQKQRILKNRLNLRIASNYKLTFADVLDPYLPESLSENPDLAKNLYICLDEIQTIASNRRSISRSNLDFSVFLTQVRKRQNQLICTTQFPSQLDRNLLMQIDLFLSCEKMYKDNGSWHIVIDVHDYWGQWTNRTWRKWWPPRHEERDAQITLHYVDKCFGMYDTEQYITPTWMDEEQRDRINYSQFDKISELNQNPPDPEYIAIDEGHSKAMRKIIGKTENYESMNEVLKDFSELNAPFFFEDITEYIKKAEPRITEQKIIEKMKNEGWQFSTDDVSNLMVERPKL